MGNEKLIAGAVMILLNLVVLAPIATSMVEDAVDDNFETYPYDSACADSDCATAKEDWATSTSTRTYYAWNLTNADEVMAGGEATTRNWVRLNTTSPTLVTSSILTGLLEHSHTTNPRYLHVQKPLRTTATP